MVFVTTTDVGAFNGPAIHVLNIVNGLARRGRRISLIAPRPSGGPAVPVHQNVDFEALPDLRGMGLPGSLAALTAVARVWRHRRSEVFYVRSSPGSIVVGLAVKAMTRGRLMVEYNGWLADEAELLGWTSLLLRPVAKLQAYEGRLADRVRVVTASLAAKVQATGTDARRISFIPTGTDIEVFRPLDRVACRRHFGLDLNKPVAVYLGNLWPAVDLQLMVASVKRLRSGGNDLELLIVGTGVDLGKLRALVAEDPAHREAFRFLGALPPDEANIALGAADIALAPFVRARNQSIGLSPMKIRDYAAAGKVTVASAFDGITDLANEPWLFLAEPENLESFASCMARALASNITELGTAARRAAEREFDWNSIVASVDALCFDQAPTGQHDP